jgi:hypothetical protein
MDKIERQRFIKCVIKKHGISIRVPRVTSQAYVQTIAKCFEMNEAGHSLLAMSLAAALIDRCRDLNGYDPLLKLAAVVEAALLTESRDYNLETTARELRSALFWGYLRIAQADVRTLEAGSRLLSTLCNCSYEMALKADAVLSHGRQGWPGDRLSPAADG